MDPKQLAQMLDLRLQVEATLQGPALRVSQLLDLKPGSLLGTARLAGESVDVFAGTAYIGTGELSVANGHAAVRMLRLGGQR